MQGAGLNQSKVGDQSAVLLDSFHAADQIGLGRVVKQNDRRTGIFFVFDNYIDFQFGELVVFRLVHPIQQSRQRIAFFGSGRLFGSGQKIVNIVDNVFLNVFKKFNRSFMAFVLMAQSVDRIFYRRFNELLTQLLGFFALFVFPARQILRGVFDFLLHIVKVFNQRLFFFFGKFVESVRTQNFAVLNRGNHKADRHMQQRNAFAFGLFLQQADIFFFFLLVFFLNNGFGRFIFIAVKDGVD